jgi:hypothetical protein
MDFRSRVLVTLGCASVVAGCRSKSAVVDAPAASASATPKVVSAVPPEEIQRALNPAGDKPYSGPIGTLRGTVRVAGDPAPASDVRVPPGACDDARAFYAKLFREGPNHELGDVLVAVTGYNGYVPPTSDVRVVTAKGCAFESRTIAMTFGQRLDVVNKGGEAVTPDLVGAHPAALVVAMPGGDPVKLFPVQVGQYALKDVSHPFATADVFVLKYATFAVTGLDGKFEIPNIPAGQVKVSAYLPATRALVEKTINLESGAPTVVDLTLPYSSQAAPKPSASP